MMPSEGVHALTDGSTSASGHASVAVGGSSYAPINTQYFAGGLNLYVGRRPYDIVELTPPEAKVPQYLRHQPSRLLAAAHRIVAFQGREAELGRLAEWRDGSRLFDVCLIHGAGGQGKTRLAMRFAELSAEAGWSAFRGGLASSGLVLPTEPDQLSSGQNGRLVIVDYAERWPVALLRGLLGDARLHDAPTRVILLARPAGNWWRQIATYLEVSFHSPATRIQLNPMPASSGDQERLFSVARDRFATVMGVTGKSDLKLPADWGDEATALDVQMAALAAVYASAREEAVPDRPGALSSYLLQREWEHWGELHATAGRPTTPESMGKAVYLACLAGPMRYDQAGELLSTTGATAPGTETNHLLDDHRLCYPVWSGEEVFPPLRPERMSEDFIALLSSRRSSNADIFTGDFEPDPWTAGKVATALITLGANAPDRMASMLTKAVAVAHRWQSFADNHLGPLIAEFPDKVLACGGPLLSALADVRFLDATAIAALESRMQLDGAADLMDSLAVLTWQLYHQLHHDAPADEATVAIGLRLARRLVGAGRPAEAIEPIEAVVRQLRRPRPNHGNQRQARLAVALGCMAEAYEGADRTEDALINAELAIKHWRTSGAVSDEADAALAEVLTVRARLMFSRQRYVEAVENADEVAAIWEILTDKNPASRLKLARSLRASAHYLTAAGHGQRAHDTAERAISCWRDLEEADPGTYLVDLLDVLLLVAGCDAAPINRRLDAGREACNGFWRLWKRDITLLPLAAEALATLTETLNRAGHYDSAQRYARRARNISLHLYNQDPTRYGTLSARCHLAFAQTCLNSHQSLEDGLEAALRGADHALSSQSPLAREIDRVTAGLLRALGRETHSDWPTIHRRATPQFEGSFERAAKISHRVETNFNYEPKCRICGGTGMVWGETVGSSPGNRECLECWMRRRQEYGRNRG